MRVLLTGGGGQVATAVHALAPEDANVKVLTREQLDISSPAAVEREVGGFDPQVIINAAAFTAVDRAESEPAQAAAVNAAGPAILARAAARLPDCRLLHISTDYVFDGSSKRPYEPTDETHPLGVYGQTKLEGERAALAQLAGRVVVLRTAWVYAPRGRNFLLTMLRVMRERGEVRVVTDQTGSPTAASSIARALWRLVEMPDAHGIFHWTDSGTASWYDFALAIARDGARVGLLSRGVRVEPISSAQYPTPARRPPYSVLNCSRTTEVLGLHATPWRSSLSVTLEGMAESPAA